MKRLLFVAFVPLGCDASEADGVPQQTARPVSSATDEACEACHPAVAAQWAGSRHHRAFTNIDFQRSYTREPEPFCRDCHAPGTKDVDPEFATAAEHRGIDCRDCHGDGDAVQTGPGPSVDAPHEIARSQEFGTESCARCHEFAFPESSRRPASFLMQSTMLEHAQSPFSERSCASCHFSADGGGVDHSQASTRSPEAWRRALRVEARASGSAVAFTLRPVGVGHALPTGDLFRRLALHVEWWVADERVSSATRYLARHFEPWRREDGSLNPAYAWPVRDDRVAAQTEFLVEAEGAGRDAGGEWVWWVEYQRVDAREDDRPQDATIASAVRIAGGRISSQGLDGIVAAN